MPRVYGLANRSTARGLRAQVQANNARIAGRWFLKLDDKQVVLRFVLELQNLKTRRIVVTLTLHKGIHACLVHTFYKADAAYARKLQGQVACIHHGPELRAAHVFAGDKNALHALERIQGFVKAGFDLGRGAAAQPVELGLCVQADLAV